MTEYAFVVADAHDVSDETRDDHGRWTKDGGGETPEGMISVAGSNIALKGTPEGTGTPEDPIYVGKDIPRAVQLLAQDKSIRMDDEKVASVLIARLGEYSQQLKDQGVKAPPFDLCNVSVGDTNLFCQGSLGIPRIEMPQLRGVAEDGTPAAEKRTDPSDSTERISIEPEYVQALRESGVSIEEKTVDARMLRPTQAEINGGKVGRLVDDMINGNVKDFNEKPIWISRDGYVLDGHHRWAAGIAQSLLVGGNGGTINVREVQMDVGATLDFTRRFVAHMGIAEQGVSAFAALRIVFDSGAHVRFDIPDCQAT